MGSYPIPLNGKLNQNARRCSIQELYCNTLVKEGYMNELRPHPNESDLKDKMTKKYLKELKVTTCTNKVHFPFW